MNETARTLEISVATAPAPATSAVAGWSAADEAFFRIVEGVLPCTFVAGAGVLLASYDEL